MQIFILKLGIKQKGKRETNVCKFYSLKGDKAYHLYLLYFYISSVIDMYTNTYRILLVIIILISFYSVLNM